MSEELEVKTCPLGHTCRKVNPETEKVEVCSWLVKTNHNKPDGETESSEMCTMQAIPLFLSEATQKSMMTTEAVQSLRNETIKRQDRFIDKMGDRLSSDNL